VDAVLAGHDHIYERIVKGDLPYFVVGVSGSGLSGISPNPDPDSAFRYNTGFGTLLIEACAASMTFTFHSIADGVVDTYQVGATSCINEPPVAVDDSVSTSEGVSVLVDVVANDVDANLDVGSVNVACGGCGLPDFGVLTNHVDGTFTYAPDAGFVGEDSFVYEVCDTGLLCDSALVTITVSASSEEVTFEQRIGVGSDDAEERPSGRVSLSSSDLEMVQDKSNTQVVGLRWDGVSVPQGATIVEAWVQFQADETDTGVTNLVIAGHDIDDSVTFVNSSGDVSGRSTTTATVAWTPDPWDEVGRAGPAERTPDLAEVIQEIIDRPQWAAGNGLTLVVSGTGQRTAEAYNGNANAAPLLHITYTTG
ncbi:MAG: cadherin-like domain-containing protein, partial [Acidimicrobiia bacterium]|nr:cadherin-like domain-containing protein [Acidimicrobiia bacterium]